MTHRPILTHTRAQLAEALAKLPGTKAPGSSPTT